MDLLASGPERPGAYLTILTLLILADAARMTRPRLLIQLKALYVLSHLNLDGWTVGGRLYTYLRIDINVRRQHISEEIYKAVE